MLTGMLRGVVAAVLVASSAQATWRSEYAQLSPAEQQWFREQKNPTTKIPCCSDSDGSRSQEDIRGEHYWTRFTAKANGGPDEDSGWMEVPDGAVIHDANKHGAPVTWYYRQDGALKIRCYSPGGGF